MIISGGIARSVGNVFYLVIDRLRTRDNVYFLNPVTEQDLLSLAEKGSGRSGGGSTSGIPSAPGSGTAADSNEPELPENPPAKNNSGGNTGMLLFMLIGIVAFGGVAYYFKIVRPKKQPKDEDDESMDDYEDEDGEDEDEYLSRAEDSEEE